MLPIRRLFRKCLEKLRLLYFTAMAQPIWRFQSREQRRHQKYSSIVQQYDFQLVPDMGHESSQEEMRIIQKFLVNQLPPKSTI